MVKYVIRCEICKTIKEKHKDDHFFIFLLTLSLKKKGLVLFLNYLHINLVCLKTLWYLLQNNQFMLIGNNIMNGCLKIKMFLDNLGITQITPWHKKKNKGNKENYKLVSILSIFWKAFERLIHRKLRSSKEPKFSIFLTDFKKNHNMLHWGSL